MSASQHLVLVVGAGRSGTSTMAGALHRLGLVAPEPHVPPDETNPRGFYEPQWVVDLHKRLLDEILVRTNDARPGALALAAEAADDDALVRQLGDWLGEQVTRAEGRDLVVKDPRTMWFTGAWHRAAERHGLRVCYVTMVRHPVEVARSRDTSYLASRSDEFRAKRETANIASWVNGAVVTERVTRGHPRAFVRYPDLLGDWRVALRDVAARIDLDYPLPPVEGEPHAVDDFIEPRLNRSRVTWDDVSIWPELRGLAATAWEALDALAEDPASDEAGRRLEEVGEAYTRAHEFAEAVTLDHTNVSVQQARRQLRRKLQQGPTGPAAAPGRAGSVLGRIRRRVLGG